MHILVVRHHHLTCNSDVSSFCDTEREVAGQMDTTCRDPEVACVEYPRVFVIETPPRYEIVICPSELSYIARFE